MLFLTKYTSISLVKNFVFVFHLPIFLFVAGYFSKIGPNEPKKAVKSSFNTIYPILYYL